MHFMDDSHYDVLINESVIIKKPDGSPLLVLLKNVLSPERVSEAWSVLKKVNMKTENRGTATGTHAVPRRKTDGTMSKVTRVPKGWEVISGVIGFFERTVRMPYAHKCSWNLHNEAAFQHLLPLFQQCSGLFSEMVPDRYEAQKSYVDRTHKDWIIPGTVYTTVTVNKNFRTAAHLDAGDLQAGFSNMAVLCEGNFRGGHLVLPNWRLAVQLGHGDLVMFDAHEYHGNTQIVPLTKNSMRCTLVMYYRENLVKCGSMEEELNFAKNRKPGEPLYVD